MIKSTTITYAARVTVGAAPALQREIAVLEWSGHSDGGLSLDLYSEYGTTVAPLAVYTPAMRAVERAPGSLDYFRIRYQTEQNAAKYDLAAQGWARVTLPACSSVTVAAVVDSSATTAGVLEADSGRPLVMVATKTAALYHSGRAASDPLWSLEFVVPIAGITIPVPMAAVEVSVYTPAAAGITTDFVLPMTGAAARFTGRALVPPTIRLIRYVPVAAADTTAVAVFRLGA